MARQKVKRLTSVPHFDRLIDAARDDLGAIRRELHIRDRSAVLLCMRILLLLDQSERLCGKESEVRARKREGAKLKRLTSVPHFDRLVNRDGDDGLAVRR